MSITTTEAADMLRVSTTRVRRMVMEGKLHPLVPGARPLAFREADVVEYELAHRKNRDHISRLAEQWRALAS